MLLPVHLCTHAVSQPETVVVFDNGKKAQEVRMYAPLLVAGAGFFVHDWPDEISLHDIRSVVTEHGFVPLYQMFAQQLVSHLRFFQKHAGA